MSFGDAWQRAGDESGDFKPPDGTYTAKLIDARAFTARTSQRDKVAFTWQLVGGELAGRQFDDLNDVDASNPTGVRITRDACVLMGLDASAVGAGDSIDDLNTALFDIVGVTAEISVKHKDGWCNVDVLSVATGQSDVTPAGANGGPAPEPAPAAAGGFAAAAGRDDDDIPF